MQLKEKRRIVVLFTSGLLVGLAVFWALGTRQAGQQPLVSRSILIPLSARRALHLHHWVLAILLGVATFALLRWKKVSVTGHPGVPLWYGFLTAMLVNGLTYKDRFKFIVLR